MNEINNTNILISHGSRGQGRASASDSEVQSTLSASHNSLYLTNLMSEIASKANLTLAFKAVKRNKGAPGIDKMTVEEVTNNLNDILEELSLTLINQTYRPCDVRGVKIPKANGKLRQLGIPTVTDRIVQQAIAQVLTKIYDPTFSNSSFGFRPKRSANMAIKASSGYVDEGNIWVVDIDLERRGHKFCRYADDCNIYVKSEMAGKRVMASITKFLKDRLKLTVNEDKSAVAKVKHRQFLGFRILNNADITIAKTSLKKIKDKIRTLTKRNRPVSLDVLIKELNQVIRGWYHYFKDTKSKSVMKELDSWIRRRIRCFRIKQRKRKYSIKTMLTAMKINEQDAWSIACSSVGWWRKSLNHIVHKAMNLDWFSKLGLFSLSVAFGKHNSKTAVCDIACTVV